MRNFVDLQEVVVVTILIQLQHELLLKNGVSFKQLFIVIVLVNVKLLFKSVEVEEEGR